MKLCVCSATLKTGHQGEGSHQYRNSLVPFASEQCSLNLLTEVGTQSERSIVVQLLVTGPAYRIAHSLDLNLCSKFQSFPIGHMRQHKLCLPNLARQRGANVPKNPHLSGVRPPS